MKKLILFCSLLAFFLLTNAPASLLSSYFEPLQINAIKGTIWQGQVSSRHFQKLSWDFTPLNLLLGKLGADINLQLNPANQLKTHLNLNLFGEITLTDINANINTDYLEKFTPNSAKMLKATLKTQQARANWRSFADLKNYFPSAAKGMIIAEKVNFLGEKIGDYQIHLNWTDDSLNGTLKSTPKSDIIADIDIKMDAKRILKLKGNLQAKSDNLEEIFKQLNISNQFNYQLNLADNILGQ